MQAPPAVCPLCQAPVYALPRVVLIPQEQAISVDAELVRLVPQHYRLVEAMFSVAPRTAGKEFLIQALWNERDEPQDPENVVAKLIHRINVKLNGTALEVLNSREVGYRLALKEEGCD